MGVDQFFNLAVFFLASFILFRFIWLITSRKPKNVLPPGPQAFPVIGHLHLLKKPLHRTMLKLSEEHGDVMFLQLGVRKLVVLSSPRAVEECFGKNDILFANRNETVSGKLLHYNCGTIGFCSYGDRWRNLRRIATLEILSQHRLAMFASIRQEEVNFLLRDLYEESHDSKPVRVNLRSSLSALSLNIMMRMVAGKRYYGKDVMNEEARQFQEVFKEILVFHRVVNLEDYFPILRFVDIQGLKKSMMTSMNKLDRLLQNLVDEHRRRRSESTQTPNASSGKDTERKKTFIDILLSSQETEPEFLTDQTIKAITQSLLVAGTEITTTTLEWAISLLLNHPGAMKKALTEIETVVGKDRLLDESDLPKLNYLGHIITETMRLYPPLPLLLPHRSSEDCEIGGYEIPKGTMLMANVWKIQRDAKLWDEADKFKPERFDGKEGEGYKMLPFGAGRRACPGANLGRRVVALTLGALIQSFELEKLQEGPIDMTESSGVTMPKEKPLQVFCKPRKIAIQAFDIHSAKEN